MIKRNLIANYIGQGWVALMNIAFIPLYIKYLGMEAYGLIGIFAVLQTSLSVLDMGMTPTLTREMARFTAGSRDTQSVQNLLRSIEIISVVIFILICGSIYVSSEWLAARWVNVEKLQIDQVAHAFIIMGWVVALRFIEGVYRGCIIGLQKQVKLNLISIITATLRGLGSVVILAWVSPDIQTFFVWQGVISIITVLAFALITYGSLSADPLQGSFDLKEIQSVWRFAGGMLGITLLSLMLMQIDKVLLSKQLSLSEYGYYALASSVAGALFTLIAPIAQAVYPRLCELHSRNDEVALARLYHKSTQFVSVFAGSAAVVVLLFSETLLRLWTQDASLAADTAQLLSLLMLGNLFNGLMWVPYQTQLSYGWTGLTIRINFFAVLIIIPTLIVVVPTYGALGAAWVWVAINAGYIFIGVNFMYRQILRKEKYQWYYQDLFKPLIAEILVAGSIKVTWTLNQSTLYDFEKLAFVSILTFMAATIASDEARKIIKKTLYHKYLRTQ